MSREYRPCDTGTWLCWSLLRRIPSAWYRNSSWISSVCASLHPRPGRRWERGSRTSVARRSEVASCRLATGYDTPIHTVT